MSHAIAKVCAAINADDAVVRLDADEMREVIDALDERERSIGRERTRADAAEAEVARLREEHAELIECLLADRNALRAIVEGRTAAPTDAELRAHMDSGGAWLVTIPARKRVRLHPETRYVDQPREASLLWWTEGARWIAVRDGRPCPWPVTP